MTLRPRLAIIKSRIKGVNRMTSQEGINQAYDFVLPSYGWAIQRVDAAASRLQNLQTFAAILTFAAPVIVKALNPEANLMSGWFLSAFLIFAFIGLISLIVRLWPGGIKLINPSLLKGDDWLLLSEEQFKLEMVRYAGMDMDDNVRFINSRAYVSDVLTILFIAEVVLLAIGAWQAL
jgi:hypothetical protein